MRICHKWTIFYLVEQVGVMRVYSKISFGHWSQKRSTHLPSIYLLGTSVIVKRNFELIEYFTALFLLQSAIVAPITKVCDNKRYKNNALDLQSLFQLY
jgi:hypothetical protein